jgi:hypothetical protein
MGIPMRSHIASTASALLAFLGLALVLSGCAKIPIATQWKLRSFKIEAADLGPLRVAIRAPGWIVPTPDSGKLILSYWREGEEAPNRTVTLRLKRANYAQDKEALAELAGAGPIAVFEIDRRDVAVAAQAQDDERRRKRDDASHGRAELTADRAACRSGEVPAGPILLDVYVHTDDATGWLAFLQAYDLRPDAAHEQEFLEKFAQNVPPCGKLADRVDTPKAVR